jgi:hypothetical protein
MSADPSVIVPENRPCGHAVQFYDADESALIDNVGRYLAVGLVGGEHAIVVTTPEHQAAFIADLERAGVDATGIIDEGRLRFLDAEATLALLMVDGYPDIERFDEVVGRLVRRVKSHAPAGLRAYGEMVGILWDRGEYPAAIRLEQLWHRLLKTVDFQLFCAYPIDIFGDHFEIGLVDAVLCAHTHLVPHAPDDDLERAIGRAMREVLHPNIFELREDTYAHRALWPSLPRGIASVLWLKANEPEHAREILERARTYYHASRLTTAPRTTASA